ncbi:uncharacterized protein LOC134847680 [Symsagittifera roscoffensis]|uniref:uncharacterized protein LOC134847680 n=1 Tax=Symsagittifera roscoffensis TaxID=84072 RepID=UPI00307C14BC
MAEANSQAGRFKMRPSILLVCYFVALLSTATTGCMFGEDDDCDFEDQLELQAMTIGNRFMPGASRNLRGHVMMMPDSFEDYWEDFGFAQQLPCFTQSMGLTGGFRGLHQSGARSVPRAGNAMPGSGWIHGRNMIPPFGQERRPQPTFNQYYFHYEIFD